MRVVALSDTHLYRPEIPDGDVLIHAGDLCLRGTAKEFESEIVWLKRQSHTHKIFVPGNHDRCVESSVSLNRKLCRDLGITMLVDDWVDIDGIKFFGCPHTPEFMSWSFMHTSEQAREHWNWNAVMYADMDVWITHGPPYGIHDSCPLPAGCPHLLKAVESVKPRLHLMGHIHEGYSGRIYKRWKTGGVTVFANISVLDGHYQPAADPMVFDIDADNLKILDIHGNAV